MKVLLINGSPKENGCTYTALNEIAVTLDGEGIHPEIFYLGKEAIQGCIDCRSCSKTGSCAFKNDKVSEGLEKIKNSDGIVFGSPVYYGGITGHMTAFMNRLFFSNRTVFSHKPAAAVVCCRRAGATAALEQLNKYLVINQMLLVGSQYWAMVHGHTPEEARHDFEGMQTMRVLGRNMAWILKSIQAGREAGIGLPKPEPERFWTHYINL
jgi:multimeric flavodoxin WrbA